MKNLTVNELNLLIKSVDCERENHDPQGVTYKRLTGLRIRLVEHAIEVNGGVDD